MREALKYLQAGAIVPVDMETTILLVNALKEALAQPAQEPWRESASDYERGVIDGMQKQAQSSVDKAVNRMAQRPWVGLTFDEKNNARYIEDWKTDYMAAVIEYIEAKLKEKNNG